MRKWLRVIGSFFIICSLLASVALGQHCQAYVEKTGLDSGIMLDCARRYYSVDEIKRYVDILANNSDSFLQLHLSDNENVGVECKTLGQCAGEETLCEDGSYCNSETQKQFLSYGQIEEILSYAQEKGVEVIPEIDMPGHMNGFFRLAEAMFGYDYIQTIAVNQNEVLGELNITEAASKELVSNLLCEYAELFQSCNYFHMGFDEYWTNYGERLIDFMNEQAAFLQNRGFIVRIWNDLLKYDNIDQVNRDIEVVFWSHDGATGNMEVREQRTAERLSVPQLQEKGFRIVITNSYYLYFVPSARSCTKEALDYTVNDILNNWDLSRWDANYEGGLSSYNNITAAMIAVWGEDSEGIADDVIRSQAERMYYAMLEKIADVEIVEPTTEQATTTEQLTTTEQATTEQATTTEQLTTTEQVTTIKKQLSKVKALKWKKTGVRTIRLSWKKQSSCAGYKIYKYNQSKGRYKLYKTTKKNTVKIVNLRLKATHKFKVRSYCIIDRKTKYGSYSKVVIVKLK